MARGKLLSSFDEAVADVQDSATILFGGFQSRGVATNLILALHRKGVKGITAVCNDACGGWRGSIDVAYLIEARRVKKLITSFPVAGSPSLVSACETQWRNGELEVELNPQGTLAERIRAGGAGIAAFWTPTGAGTQFGEGKETRVFGGREHVLERAIKGDFAFISAAKTDTLGNLVYHGMARNFNPVMATAAAVTIVEAKELVQAGEIDPERVITPGVYVDRIVVAAKG